MKRMFIFRKRTFSLFQAFLALKNTRNKLKTLFLQLECARNILSNSSTKRMFISRKRTFSIFQAFIALINAQNKLKTLFLQLECARNILRNSSMKRMFNSRNRTFSLFQAFIALLIAQNELKSVISSTRMRWEYPTQFQNEKNVYFEKQNIQFISGIYCKDKRSK